MPVLPTVETKILNVNDDAATRYLWGRMLREAGYQVREAETGQAALETLMTDRPHLVLLDVKLPDIDGFSVCQKIKSVHPTVPILMASAWFTSDDDFINGLANGADGYLCAPADSARLLAMIQTILRMSTRLHQAWTSEKALRRENEHLQQCVEQMQSAHEDLQAKLAESHRFEEAVIGRELKLIECEKERERLRREVAKLKGQDRH
jgi:DNA-binding response OmpR family regulator